MATVISIGIHIVDILGRPVTSIPPGQNVDLLEEIRITVAGTAAGTSVDLAKLGAKVVAMGAVGTDELGNFLVNTMNSYGIDTSNLVRKSGVQSSATMLPIRPNGERPALHVPGANGEMTLEDVNWDVIKSAKFLHMGGTSLMPKFDGPPTVELLKFAHEHGVTTTFDLVAVERPDLLDLIEPCLPYIDYFMPSLDEAEMMLRTRGIDYHSRQDVIDYFLDRGAKQTVFKMGAQGSSIASKAFDEIRLPAFKVNVVDTTGCGDAYCAGFIYGLSQGWTLQEAGRLGTAASGLVATGLGSDAGIVNLAETLTFMHNAEQLPMTQ
ncbi:MAG TPA: sugar kinase [Caldilineaceae bacterium]|nr:sugar kinase [Caldilineaceae bacterium]